MAAMLLFVHPDWFLQPGLMVILVMATLSATTEYRFSTVRVTFTATPNRTVALLAKAVVVAALAGVAGLTASFGAWGLTWLTAGDAARPLRSPWLPFANAGHFLVGDRAVPAAAMPFGPWVSLSYFAGVTAGSSSSRWPSCAAATPDPPA